MKKLKSRSYYLTKLIAHPSTSNSDQKDLLIENYRGFSRLDLWMQLQWMKVDEQEFKLYNLAKQNQITRDDYKKTVDKINKRKSRMFIEYDKLEEAEKRSELPDWLKEGF